MADIKTMTEEITELNVDIKEAMIGGDYWEIVKVLDKIIEKIDEVIEEINS